MKQYILIFTVIISFTISNSYVHAQMKEAGFAKITFVSKEDDQAKSFISTLRKGNLSRLRYDLTQGNAGTTNEVDVDNTKGSLDGYVNQIVVGRKKQSVKKRNKADHDNLLGNYDIKDQESLLDVKVKKLKEVETRASEKDDSGNYLKYNSYKNRKNDQGLSRYYKISRGRRLRNGTCIKKPAGNITLIITYKIREGRYMNTYVNMIDGYLSPNSRYNLKYHGTGSKRQYYLEFVSKSK
jgi:hypothetical protein